VMQGACLLLPRTGRRPLSFSYSHRSQSSVIVRETYLKRFCFDDLELYEDIRRACGHCSKHPAFINDAGSLLWLSARVV
jgi:hypothetical protein